MLSFYGCHLLAAGIIHSAVIGELIKSQTPRNIPTTRRFVFLQTDICDCDDSLVRLLNGVIEFRIGQLVAWHAAPVELNSEMVNLQPKQLYAVRIPSNYLTRPLIKTQSIDMGCPSLLKCKLGAIKT